MVMFISFVLVSYTHSNPSFQMMEYNLSDNGEVENGGSYGGKASRQLVIDLTHLEDSTSD